MESSAFIFFRRDYEYIITLLNENSKYKRLVNCWILFMYFSYKNENNNLSTVLQKSLKQHISQSVVFNIISQKFLLLN